MRALHKNCRVYIFLDGRAAQLFPYEYRRAFDCFENMQLAESPVFRISICGVISLSFFPFRKLLTSFFTGRMVERRGLWVVGWVLGRNKMQVTYGKGRLWGRNATSARTLSNTKLAACPVQHILGPLPHFACLLRHSTPLFVCQQPEPITPPKALAPQEPPSKKKTNPPIHTPRTPKIKRKLRKSF